MGWSEVEEAGGVATEWLGPRVPTGTLDVHQNTCVWSLTGRSR